MAQNETANITDTIFSRNKWYYYRSNRYFGDLLL